jgi:predicted negative regulator of RcsB-dependent stress response
MSRIVTLVLLFLLAASCFGQEPQDIPAYLVSVEIQGTEQSVRNGIVTQTGRVVTTVEPLEHAVGVRIRRPDGQTFDTTGIVSYNRRMNLALLAVDWKDAQVPGAVLCSSVKPSTEGLWAVRLNGKAVERLEARTSWVSEGWVGLGFKNEGKPGVNVQWGGAPILTPDGQVVAFISGSAFRAGIRIDAKVNVAGGIHGTRAELVRGLEELPVIGWTEWPKTYGRIQRSDAMTHQLSGLARKQGIGAAQGAAREALELDPRNAYAWIIVATGMLEGGEYESAMDAARKSLSIHPTDAFCHHVLAMSLSRLERHDEALAEIERAIELDPKDFKWQTDKGFVLEAQGRDKEALECYQSALKINPNDGYAKEAIARLTGEDSPKVRPKW